jgi:hypothetical protein
VHRLMTMERFRRVFVAYIVYASFKTLVMAPQLAAQHGAPLRALLYVLAGVEVLAALGLLVRRIAGVASLALLGVFILATLLDVALGEIPAHLVLYAAITLLLLTAETTGASAGRAAPNPAASGGR